MYFNMDNFIFLSVTSNYPIAFTAGNTKMEYMARGLNELGCCTLALNNWASSTNSDMDESGISKEGIEYITFNNEGNINIIKNYKKTCRILKERKSNNKSNIAILSTSRSHYMLLDIIAARKCGYKTLFLFHEWRSALKMHSIFHKIDAWIKDHIIIRLFDAYLPISHYLLEKCNKVSNKKKKLIVPVLADFSRTPQKSNIKERFTYCCGIWFIMRHPMLLDAMDFLVEKHPNSELMLILSGNKKDIALFSENIKARKSANNITIRTKVPFDELNDIYSCSLGLIIPLEPDSIADTARFSQKIAEYIATGRPIITNAVGEIPYYFKNKESAYITEYSAEGFYKVMDEIIREQDKATQIGNNGFEVGKTHFDYRKSSIDLVEFSINI